MKKNILVTGGNGFIGRNFLEYASTKYNLIHPSRKELDLLDGEAVDEFFCSKKIGVVLHCANIGGARNDVDTEKTMKDNLKIFFNIVKNKDRFGKMIHLGSGAEYDKSSPIKKVKESDFGKTIPQDNYGFYKYVCSKYIENSDRIICLRPFGIFGKYEDWHTRFISSMLLSYIRREPMKMVQNGYFDYIDVYDLCLIIDHFIVRKSKYTFYNVGSGKRYELLSIAKMINKLDDYRVDIQIGKKGLNKEYTCNNGRLMDELRDFKITPLSLSIKNLYKYFRDNKGKFMPY